MSTFSASAIQSAFEDIAVNFNITIQQASYLTSIFIAILGVAPLFWRPLANRYGRRPVFILALLCSLASNLGSANSPSYATMMFCRAVTAFFISPPSALGSAVVAETFFKKDRARFMGIWTLMVILGIPLAPFLMGFVAYRVGYRWIYYILACANAVNLLLYLFLGPETLYMRSNKESSMQSRQSNMSAYRRQFWHLSRIDPTPLRLYDFVQPLTMIAKPSIAIPTIAHATIFLFAIFISLMIPQLFGSVFHMNTEQVGLQYLALMVGSVLGEQISAVVSDRWMLARQKKLQGIRPPHEFRLWLSYPGFVLAIVGLVVFLIQIGTAAAAETPTWNVTPLVGAAVMYAGNQIITTTLITYAVDCYREEAASVGVLISLVRQLFGFAGPFWFPAMIDRVGLKGSAGVCAAVMVGASVLPIAFLQLFGKRWR